MRFAIFLALISVACNRPGGGDQQNPAKFQQYYNQGERLYVQHCSNCHQKTGTGLGRVYPPLNVSDFVDERLEEVICLMRNGRTGELTVNGIMYNLAMPPTTLSDLEIAEIATYIYNTWGRERGILEVSKVALQLQRCDSIPARD